MDGMLSQDEINALLNGMSLSSDSEEETSPVDELSQQANEEFDKLTDVEIDALGEISNISMGTAATTLSALLNQKVTITTPNVSYATWTDVSQSYQKPCVLLRISYVEGLDGDNILILKEDDVKIITNLMMGGDGTVVDEELTDLHLSAIGEAMNQMMGSASTSMSSMLNAKIDISPPLAELADLNKEHDYDNAFERYFVKIAFQMTVGSLVDSQIMQLYPIGFAKELYKQFAGELNGAEKTEPVPAPAPEPQPQPVQAPMPEQQPYAQPMMQGMPMQGMPMQGMPMMNYAMPQFVNMAPAQQVDVSPASFQPFSGDYVGAGQKENIDLIMDVPLEVTVELGRTHKSIKEILEFTPGSILELKKIAGEPVDVLVNGKYVAKGEVVVIEESFGVRISEIIR